MMFASGIQSYTELLSSGSSGVVHCCSLGVAHWSMYALVYVLTDQSTQRDVGSLHNTSP